MTGLKSMRPAALAASMLLVLQDAASAQESGSFRVLHSYVQDYSTIDHAGGAVTGGSLVGTSTVLESSGPPFVEGETGVVRCIVFARASPDGVELEAPCAVTDDTGDELFLLARRRDGDTAEGGGGTGTYVIMGGTGKYADVAGECPYEARYLPENLVVSPTMCTWRRP